MVYFDVLSSEILDNQNYSVAEEVCSMKQSISWQLLDVTEITEKLILFQMKTCITRWLSMGLNILLFVWFICISDGWLMFHMSRLLQGPRLCTETSSMDCATPSMYDVSAVLTLP